VGTPREQIHGFVVQNRIVGVMFTIFGLVAVVLASVGIYGVTSFSVSQRTQEIGVRMALGADNGRIIRMLLGQGSWQTGLGLLVGISLTLALVAVAGDGIQSVLFGVACAIPWSTPVAALVAVVCCSPPGAAYRATRVDPMIALRAE
jgi:ABC-type antimicrobial peptide transport system permease subunit